MGALVDATKKRHLMAGNWMHCDNAPLIFDKQMLANIQSKMNESAYGKAC